MELKPCTTMCPFPWGLINVFPRGIGDLEVKGASFILVSVALCSSNPTPSIGYKTSSGNDN